MVQEQVAATCLLLGAIQTSHWQQQLLRQRAWMFQAATRMPILTGAFLRGDCVGSLLPNESQSSVTCNDPSLTLRLDSGAQPGFLASILFRLPVIMWGDVGPAAACPTWSRGTATLSVY